MKKENIVILVVITFVVGFMAGAVSGIKFYSSEKAGRPVAQGQPVQENDRPPISADEISRAEATVRSDPRNTQALVTLGNLYFDSNQYAKAIDNYEKALAIEPNNPDVRTDLGIMYRAIKEYDRAVKEFREAARIDPTHANSRFNLGVVLQNDKKDLQGALAAWEDFLRLEPTGDRANAARAEMERLRSVTK
jgi:cytochrome c-type biogenesis protein CcmH/NrfG